MPIKPGQNELDVFQDRTRIVATIDIGSMWDRMLGEFLDEWARLERQGLSEEEIQKEMRAFMEGLSTKPEEDLARKSSSVAYNQGRAAVIESASRAGAVEFVVRSEVLDQSTCEMCEMLDGAVIEVNSDAFEQLMPPSYCRGGDRCRGFYVAVG